MEIKKRICKKCPYCYSKLMGIYTRIYWCTFLGKEKAKDIPKKCPKFNKRKDRKR